MKLFFNDIFLYSFSYTPLHNGIKFFLKKLNVFLKTYQKDLNNIFKKTMKKQWSKGACVVPNSVDSWFIYKKGPSCSAILAYKIPKKSLNYTMICPIPHVAY